MCLINGQNFATSLTSRAQTNIVTVYPDLQRFLSSIFLMILSNLRNEIAMEFMKKTNLINALYVITELA